jgi:hypothetical protein
MALNFYLRFRATMSCFRPRYFVLLLALACPRDSHAQLLWKDAFDVTHWMLSYFTYSDTIALNRNHARTLAASGDSVHFVYSSSKDGIIWYAHSFDGGQSWRSYTWPLDSLRISDSSCDYPAIAVQGPNVHVVYRKFGAINKTYYRRSTDGGMTWLPRVLLGAYNMTPAIAADGKNIFVALNGTDFGNSEIWLRRSTDNGATWDTAIRISNAEGRSEHPSVTVSQGHVYLAWNDTRDTGIVMETYGRISSDNGVTWGGEMPLNKPITSAEQACIDAYGPNVDLVWINYEYAGYDVFHRHSTDFGATWSPEHRLSDTVWNSSYTPTVTRDHNEVYIMWIGIDQRSHLFTLHSTDGGTTWKDDEILGFYYLSQSYAPVWPCVVASDGHVHTIWSLYDYDQYPYGRSVFYSRLEYAVEFPGDVNFDTVQAGTIHDTTLIIHNCMGVPVHIGRYTFSGDSVFSVDTSIHVIEPYSDVELHVQFAPPWNVRDTFYGASLSIIADDGFSGHGFSMQGVAHTPSYAVGTTGYFGVVDSGECYDKGILIYNNASTPITLSSATITMWRFNTPSDSTLDTSAFRILSPVPVTIAAHSNSVIDIRFCPPHALYYQGTIALQTTKDSLGFSDGTNSTYVWGWGRASLSDVAPTLEAQAPRLQIEGSTLIIGGNQPLADITITFYDVVGRRISTQQCGSSDSGLLRVPLDLSQVQGILFARVVSRGEMIGTCKIVR